MNTITSTGFLMTSAEIKHMAIAPRNMTVVSHLVLSNIDLICLQNPTRKPVLCERSLPNYRNDISEGVGNCKSLWMSGENGEQRSKGADINKEADRVTHNKPNHTLLDSELARTTHGHFVRLGFLELSGLAEVKKGVLDFLHIFL